MAVDVRTICLALLSQGSKTGYEIKKSFEEGPLGYFIEASFGSIYPALGRLTDEGLIECRTQAQDGRPDRKIYSLTSTGQMAFQEALLLTPGPDRFRSEFLFLLMFADKLPPEHLNRVINERLTDYRNKLKQLEAPPCSPLSPGLDFMRGHGIAVYRAIINYIEENQHLLLGSGASISARAAE